MAYDKTFTFLLHKQKYLPTVLNAIFFNGIKYIEIHKFLSLNFFSFCLQFKFKWRVNFIFLKFIFLIFDMGLQKIIFLSKNKKIYNIIVLFCKHAYKYFFMTLKIAFMSI